jgi:DNA invertase Pin-like site-specific DNA recombinase
MKGGDVGAYVRVSSRTQGYEMQLHAIEQAAKARGDKIATVYAEKRSTRVKDRKELARVRADARAGELSKLYVYKLDRLTRNGMVDTITLVRELQGLGCNVVTVADGFDIHGPAGDLVMGVLGWAAELERSRINERISAAREAKEAKGEPWGHPPRMDPKLIARARKLRGEGRSIRAIAVALKIPKTIVGRVLKEGRGAS